MRRMPAMMLGMIMVLMSYGSGSAFDMTSLDRVAVSMPKSIVHLLLGKPDDAEVRRDGLEIDIYKTDNLTPMIGTGCIYGENQRLVGQSFIFQGEMGKQAVEKLQQDGFALTEEKGDTFRLSGKDDDTGQPLVVQILQGDGLTVVMTFEKSFHDQRAK